jgi:hypothetical protein
MPAHHSLGERRNQRFVQGRRQYLDAWTQQATSVRRGPQRPSSSAAVAKDEEARKLFLSLLQGRPGSTVPLSAQREQLRKNRIAHLQAMHGIPSMPPPKPPVPLLSARHTPAKPRATPRNTTTPRNFRRLSRDTPAHGSPIHIQMGASMLPEASPVKTPAFMKTNNNSDGNWKTPTAEEENAMDAFLGDLTGNLSLSDNNDARPL